MKKTVWSLSVGLFWPTASAGLPPVYGIMAGAIALLVTQPAFASGDVQTSPTPAVEAVPPGLLDTDLTLAVDTREIDTQAVNTQAVDTRTEASLKADSSRPQARFASVVDLLRDRSSAEAPWVIRPAAAANLSADHLAIGHSAPDPVALNQGAPNPADKTVRRAGSEILGQPTLKLQGVYKQEDGDASARARLTGLYPVTPDVLFGGTVDWTTGPGFSDSPDGGVSLSELYVAVSPANLPRFRLIGGLMDYTSYFDRNSFAKDGASQFFNRVFQTNPALSAAGLASRIGLIANWSPTDNLDVKGGVFSSRRSLGSLALDSYVAEVDWRIGTLIIGGTYLSGKDAGRQTGFEEIFQFDRGNGNFGFSPGDREEAYGVNAEYYLPKLNMGFFGRYGHYANNTLGESADTYSVGTTFLDLFHPKDRLGIGYGRQLSNDGLRRQRGDKLPDVLEVYYDRPILPNLRGAVMVQARDQFSEIVFGVRLRTEINLIPSGAPRP